MQEIRIYSPFKEWGYWFTINLTDNYLFLCELHIGSPEHNHFFKNFYFYNKDWTPNNLDNPQYNASTYHKEFSEIDKLKKEVDNINSDYLKAQRDYLIYRTYIPRVIADVNDYDRSLLNVLQEEETRKYKARLDFLSLSLFRLKDRK